MAMFTMLPVFLIGFVLFLYFVPLGLWIQSGCLLVGEKLE